MDNNRTCGSQYAVLNKSSRFCFGIIVKSSVKEQKLDTCANYSNPREECPNRDSAHHRNMRIHELLESARGEHSSRCKMLEV